MTVHILLCVLYLLQFQLNCIFYPHDLCSGFLCFSSLNDTLQFIWIFTLLRFRSKVFTRRQFSSGHPSESHPRHHLPRLKWLKETLRFLWNGITIPRMIINVGTKPSAKRHDSTADLPAAGGGACYRPWVEPAGKRSFLEPSQWAFPLQRFNMGNKAVKNL